MTKLSPTLAAVLTLRGLTPDDYRRLQADTTSAASRYTLAQINDEVEEIEVEDRKRARTQQ
jgi:hypothetical protein